MIILSSTVPRHYYIDINMAYITAALVILVKTHPTSLVNSRENENAARDSSVASTDTSKDLFSRSRSVGQISREGSEACLGLSVV